LNEPLNHKFEISQNKLSSKNQKLHIQTHIHYRFKIFNLKRWTMRQRWRWPLKNLIHYLSLYFYFLLFVETLNFNSHWGAAFHACMFHTFETLDSCHHRSIRDLMKLHVWSRRPLAALLWRLCGVGQCGGWGGPN
jgi:hypothetical protein